jgi:hypothetical protein
MTSRPTFGHYSAKGDSSTMTEVTYDFEPLLRSLESTRRELSEKYPEFYGIEIRSEEMGAVVAHALPNPGASEGQLHDAEIILNRKYPDQLRALLGVANGWPQICIDYILLGTEEVGIASGGFGVSERYPGSAWYLARQAIDQMYDEVSPPGGQNLSADDCIPLASNTTTGSFVYVVAVDGGSIPKGAVVEFDSGVFTIHSGVVTLVSSFLDINRRLLDN